MQDSIYIDNMLTCKYQGEIIMSEAGNKQKECVNLETA